MKIGIITQRRDEAAGYKELREGLDVRWHGLFAALRAVAVPAPAVPELPYIMERINPDFLVLSGGNSPTAYGGDAPERDAADQAAIDYALKSGKPLLGVCRGMQSIALYFGGRLERIEGHVKTEHMLKGEIRRRVNSYHNFAVEDLGGDLKILARSEFDDSIEALRHKREKIYGLMWHPERGADYDPADLATIKEWLEL